MSRLTFPVTEGEIEELRKRLPTRKAPVPVKEEEPDDEEDEDFEAKK